MSAKTFCVKTLNFLKGLCLWFGFPFLIIGMLPGVVGDNVSYYATGVFTLYMFLVLPFYWCLVFIQKIMIIIWDNEEEYFNATDWA